MKKRKKFVIIVAMVMAVLFLTSCDCTEEDKESKDIVEEEEMEMFLTFVVLHKEDIPNSDITQYILYDPETMVMWTFMDGFKCGGPAILYNADGTPRIYEQ